MAHAREKQVVPLMEAAVTRNLCFSDSSSIFYTPMLLILTSADILIRNPTSSYVAWTGGIEFILYASIIDAGNAGAGVSSPMQV